jgi:hypothetical protein
VGKWWWRHWTPKVPCDPTPARADHMANGLDCRRNDDFVILALAYRDRSQTALHTP